MAHGTFQASTVAVHAAAKKLELEEALSREARDFIAEPRVKRSGMLWWRTERPRTMAENRYLFEHGYYEDDTDEWRGWRTPHQERLECRYRDKIRRCERLLALCSAVPYPSHVVLDDGEVTFLRLPRATV